jgi:hypothetical protein
MLEGGIRRYQRSTPTYDASPFATMVAAIFFTFLQAVAAH